MQCNSLCLLYLAVMEWEDNGQAKYTLLDKPDPNESYLCAWFAPTQFAHRAMIDSRLIFAGDGAIVGNMSARLTFPFVQYGTAPDEERVHSWAGQDLPEFPVDEHGIPGPVTAGAVTFMLEQLSVRKEVHACLKQK